MDDLTCPRRSTVHPSMMQRRDSAEESYPLSAYAVAMSVDLAQLETMSWISNDIRSAIEKYKAQYRETEEDASKDIPLLFREYITASEEVRDEILYVLKHIKANTILSAKGSWYEWKCGWVKDLQQNAERTLENLAADEQQLDDIAKRAGKILPGLRQEYEEIMRELQQEQAAVAEIENCDQAYLEELKSTIAEQREALDTFLNEVADGETKLVRLQETLEDLEEQAGEAKKAINSAQRQMEVQKTSTRAEVFRLRDELDTLQDIHLWKATQLDQDLVEFIYDSKYKVTIPCRRSSPISEKLEITPCQSESSQDDEFPVLTGYMYKLAKQYAIIQRLTDFWASYTQLRWQLKFIFVRFPTTCRLLPEGSSIDEAEGIEVAVTLLLQQKTSKVFVQFQLDDGILGYWPTSLDSLRYDVSVAYGKANPNLVSRCIEERLLGSSEGNHACLADACMDVVDKH
ncbi:hypothetical protein M422DRAFT_166538 [Sphaerobolus stellatus SS14]|uniref:Spc7 kinetochore protein domain-containing protein n=1 Tax=Sphaerobolus stellatus (strain SS14) TaxID=990650 RepID=A0A0C9US15_SPHS4|nr:hypothetical protein M422DRAFT_166538 [Sphaerobolus stellatus SS14]